MAKTIEILLVDTFTGEPAWYATEWATLRQAVRHNPDHIYREVEARESRPGAVPPPPEPEGPGLRAVPRVKPKGIL